MDFNLGMVKTRPTKTQHMIYILVFFRVTIDFDFWGQQTHIYLNVSSVRGISKMVCPKKQDFCPRINMVKGNFDTNYFELLIILNRLQKSEFLKLIV